MLSRLLQVERLLITQGVFNELLIPIEYGYEFPNQVFARSKIVALTSLELQHYEKLRLEGQISAADAEQIAVCWERNWIYVTMDRVAARIANNHGVTTVDLYALLKALLQGEIVTNEELRTLVHRMEHADRTQFPFRNELLSS